MYLYEHSNQMWVNWVRKWFNSRPVGLKHVTFKSPVHFPLHWKLRVNQQISQDKKTDVNLNTQPKPVLASSRSRRVSGRQDIIRVLHCRTMPCYVSSFTPHIPCTHRFPHADLNQNHMLRLGPVITGSTSSPLPVLLLGTGELTSASLLWGNVTWKSHRSQQG